MSALDLVVRLRWWIVAMLFLAGAMLTTWFVAFRPPSAPSVLGVEIFTDSPAYVTTPSVTVKPLANDLLEVTFGVALTRGADDVKAAFALDRTPERPCIGEHRFQKDAQVQMDPLESGAIAAVTMIYSDIGQDPVNRITCTVRFPVGHVSLARRRLDVSISPTSLYSAEAKYNRVGLSRRDPIDIVISPEDVAFGSLQFAGGGRSSTDMGPDDPARGLALGSHRTRLVAAWDSEQAKRAYDVMLVAIGALLGFFASAMFAAVQPIVDGFAKAYHDDRARRGSTPRPNPH